jgi:hypothetical protein
MGSDGDELEDISPHIRIRIDPRKKKEWLEYAQEHHYGNLTDLIKSAVDNTIDDKWVLEEKHQSDMDIDTSGLEEGIVDINDKLSIVEQKIDDLALQSGEETHTELSRDDLIKLANRCHDLLPRLQSEVQFPSLHQSFSIDLDNLPSDIDREIQSKSSADSIEWVRAKITGRAEDIANALEESVHHVRHALIFLEQSETGSLVESVNDEGERRWFVRDPDASTDFSFLEDEQQDDSPGDLFPNQ